MSLFTSSHFASACAPGTDWRDTSKNVLEQLDDIRAQDDQYNFGILYISDHLAQDASSILNLFKSVLKIDHWIGSVGVGVIGCQQSYIDTPAISAMLCNFPEDSFCLFPKMNENEEILKSQDQVMSWLTKHSPVVALVHGDPNADEDPAAVLEDMENSTNAFVIGGMTSSRSEHLQIAGNLLSSSVCGAFLSSDISIATTLSQGCEQASPYHVITKCDENTILELDEKPALSVLQKDLRRLAAQKLGKSPEDFIGDIDMIEHSDKIPAEFQSLFKGDIHIAFPRSQSDQKDYTVRDIVRLDTDEGSVGVSAAVSIGEHIFLAERNQENLEKDLTKSLIALEKRILHDRGHFDPKGALYISCIARGFNHNDAQQSEIEILHDVLGNVPMTGFYAGGEISNARIYGYTGILTLFF